MSSEDDSKIEWLCGDKNSLGRWLTGPVRCRLCDYRWVAVIELGEYVPDLECPNCGNMSGEQVD